MILQCVKMPDNLVNSIFDLLQYKSLETDLLSLEAPGSVCWGFFPASQVKPGNCNSAGLAVWRPVDLTELKMCFKYKNVGE